LPGAQVTYPSTPIEFDTLFRQVYRNGALTLFRVPAQQHGQDFPAKDIQFGKGIKVTDGTNLTIVVTGPQLSNALAAQDALSEMGWDAEIIYVHTICPLDVELIRASVSKTQHVLVLEEHMQSGGLGNDVLRETRDIANVRYAFLAVPDTFVTGYGSYQDHCDSLGLSREGILNMVKAEFGVQEGK